MSEEDVSGLGREGDHPGVREWLRQCRAERAALVSYAENARKLLREALNAGVTAEDSLPERIEAAILSEKGTENQTKIVPEISPMTCDRCGELRGDHGPNKECPVLGDNDGETVIECWHAADRFRDPSIPAIGNIEEAFREWTGTPQGAMALTVAARCDGYSEATPPMLAAFKAGAAWVPSQSPLLAEIRSMADNSRDPRQMTGADVALAQIVRMIDGNAEGTQA